MNAKRHKFDAQVIADLRSLTELDNRHAVAALTEDWAVIATAVVLPWLISHLVPMTLAGVAWWITFWLLSVPVIGFRQRALATLLHESAHGSLARNPTWNFIAGTILSGYLIFQSWCAYYHTHVRGHHGGFNGPRDVDLKFLSQQGAYAVQTRRQFIWRFLVAPMLMARTPAKIVDLFRYRFFSQDEPRWERVLKATYLLALLLILWLLGLLPWVALFWLVPYFTVFPIVNWYVELSEHFPLMRDGVEDIYMSRNRWSGWLGKFTLGIHNENFHQVHHLFMTIPFWRMKDAHAVLMRDAVYRSTQQREVGWLIPIIVGIPSIVEGMARFHSGRASADVRANTAQVNPSKATCVTCDGKCANCAADVVRHVEELETGDSNATI